MMKKMIPIVLCLVLAAALIGCGQAKTASAAVSTGDGKAAETERPQQAVAAPQDETENEPEETAEIPHREKPQSVELPELVWKASQVNSVGEPIRLSPEDSRTVYDMIASCKWETGTADCLNDYAFERDDGSVIYYHSDCGTFNDHALNRSYRLLDEQKAWVNNLLLDLFAVPYNADVPNHSEANGEGQISLSGIVDLTERDGLATDSALEEFFRDETYTYFFPSIRSEYIECTLSDGTTMPIREALEKGIASIDDLLAFGISYYKQDSDGTITGPFRTEEAMCHGLPLAPEGFQKP